MKKTPWIILLVLTIPALIWWWNHRGASPPQGARNDRNRPVPARTAQVERGEVPVILNALGTVTARHQALVRPRVDGLLQSVAFIEGAEVKAGDTLATIDPRPFAASLAVARGQLEKDRAQLEGARNDLKRYQKLLSEDSIASQEVDTQMALVKQLEGVVAADQGNVAAAELNLGFTTITAPIAGVAGLRQVDPGNMVRAGDTTGLVTITGIRPIDVVFAIPQEGLGQVLERHRHPVARAAIAVDVYGRDGRTLLGRGRLIAIDNQIDPATASTKLKAELANEDGAFFPGQFVNVQLVLETLNDALVVPRSAIQRGTPGTFVYVVSQEKTASVRPVELGPTSGERVVVSRGLALGETVVVDGADKLRDGSTVISVEPEGGKRQGGKGQGESAAGGKGPEAGASRP